LDVAKERLGVDYFAKVAISKIEFSKPYTNSIGGEKGPGNKASWPQTAHSIVPGTGSWEKS